MKLSELLALDVMPKQAYGIEVDCDDLVPPEGLEEVSIIVPWGDKGPDEDVLDLVIGYRMPDEQTGRPAIDVIMEFPSDTVISDLEYFVTISGSLTATYSMLPPPDIDTNDEAFDAYVERLVGIVPHFCDKPNLSKPLMPVSNYLQYLMIEMLDPATAAVFEPTDPYTRLRFADAMTGARADALKARLRAAFEEHFGGRESFETYCKAMFADIAAEAESILRKRMETETA